MDDFCKKCNKRLAFKTQICTACGNSNVSKNDRERKSSGFYWLLLPAYLFAEIYSFLFSLSLAELHGPSGEIEAYVTFRVLLFLAAIITFSVGKKNDSEALKGQGGCFLIINFLIIGLIAYFLIFGG